MATTFAPRSCPSCPILAIIILGRRPSFLANSSASCLAFSKLLSSFISLLYTPLKDLICALYLPKTVSKAVLISPRVARFLAASTANSSRLPSPVFAQWVNFSSESSTFSVFRVALIRSNCSSCCLRTIILSTSKICNGSSFSNLYLLTPTIVS